MRVLFVAIASCFAVAAIFHVVALFAPQVAEPSPAWRHALFAAINVAFAIGMLARPAWYVLAFAALSAQQLYSHGAYGVDVWRREERVDWASVLVVVAMPLVLALLVVDARRTRRRQVRDG